MHLRLRGGKSLATRHLDYSLIRTNKGIWQYENTTPGKVGRFAPCLGVDLWYNVTMAEKALADFIRARPHLIWYVKDYDDLGEESIVESVLNYGTWDDVQELIRLMGIDRVAKIFNAWGFVPRTNYRPKVRHYFDLYFKKHVTTA